MPSNHALLSPSSSKRWLNCTPSPSLESKMPNNSTNFADEGTLAHAYGALKLKQFIGDTNLEEEYRDIEKFKDQYHTSAMDEHVDYYTSYVIGQFNAARKKTKDARLLVETKLDFGEYIPESFGTSDANIVSDGLLEVIDLKFGTGVLVSAQRNPQMMIYALGALLKFDDLYDIHTVRMTIVQPRLDNLDTFEMSAKELYEWGEEVLKPKAKMAFAGEGEQKPGEWCRFCKVKHICRACADTAKDTYRKALDPKLLSDQELADEVLPYLSQIKTWVNSVEEFALHNALNGTNYDGFKVVSGRSTRKIEDPSKVAILLLRAGYKEESVFKPTELRTITDLEKNLGKKIFNEICGEYITKSEGKPTLVPITDKRAPLNQSAEEEFKNIIV